MVVTETEITYYVWITCVFVGEEGREKEREKKREYVQMLKKTQKNSNYRFNLDQSFSVSHHRFQRNITPSVCLMVKFLS